MIVKKMQETFAVLKPDMSVQPVAVTPSLYSELNEQFFGFKSHALISLYEFSESWNSWERHPAGDEIVMLMSGRVTLVLRIDSAEEQVELTEAGSYVVVPRNIWHTVRVTASASMLFITPGEGTENQQVR